MRYAKEEAIKKGQEIGLAKGIAKGIEKEKINIAKNLLDILDDDTISLKTGLDVSFIQSLR